ncbi:MAG: protein translocase subunit SecF [Gammaproteobacteria bacterium CG11_big_fil_rev_8_21_14_0_20_46_22]|nr:MAG: protein translocase subunit SecF [Gammaproteobacteria bacterium CG12_big_fil_rev_8_21_14_0_65_46_12]PIR11674.1 MAG: protein translocase subunit SecF [Gammaproteobacteria bacterium CG11_big_fil_rev_8_21_14_0_20_46_22]
MEFFKQNTKINFMAIRKWTAMLSCALFLVSILSLVINGLNFGLDFTGGSQIILSLDKPANIGQIRQSLEKAGFTKSNVQAYGNTREVQISVANKKTGTQQNSKLLEQQLSNKIATLVPGSSVESVNFVGAAVSSQLAYKGILAVIVALLGTMIYIAFRFEYRLAVSAAVAMIHDPVLILGFFSLFHVEFDLTSLAAVLTVLGYSLNDTIVVFDRVRENFRKMRKGSPTEVVNAAINQTLSRTVMTSGMTLIVVLALLFFGGAVIHGFALALVIGIVVGTYSSIYVAGALAVALGLSRQDLLPTAKKAIEDAP